MKTAAEIPSFLQARGAIWLGGLTLLVLLGGVGVWAATTPLSGAILASGRVEVERQRQVVQHPDGGVVAEIHVNEGDRVTAGDILLRLDDILLRSELELVENQLVETRARRARLQAERDGATEMIVPESLRIIAASNPDAARQIEGEMRLFAARGEAIEHTLDQLHRRLSQTVSQIDGIEAQIQALNLQSELVAEELMDQRTLLDQGLVPAARVRALLREDATLTGQLGELMAARAQSEGRITEIQAQLLGLQAQRREEIDLEFQDTGARELRLSQQQRALIEQLARLTIRAPISGFVLDLKFTHPAAVLRPADLVAYIIPQDRNLLVVAEIPPTHIEEVKVGQPVKVVFPGFSVSSGSDVFGEVVNLSADALVDRQTNTEFFRAQISLPAPEIERLGKTLLPGMPADVFLLTQERTPWIYLTQPITDYFRRAFRES